ncbi:MAG TPA: flavodoxin, partial [Clostridiales bacterium]|nr:flavodoxin [Clostridiales bacterium]
SLRNKKVACFVTKQLSSSWTGGNRALKSMKGICEAKGGTFAGSGIIFWKSKDRDREIDALADKMCSLFG